MLLDSPLNKAGLLQIYFRTHKNVLVEVSPQCRIPRTFDRFCGLMGKESRPSSMQIAFHEHSSSIGFLLVQLLHKMSIRAEGSPVKLLNVIKNPVTDHLPIGCRKYLMTYNTDHFMLPRSFAEVCLSCFRALYHHHCFRRFTMRNRTNQ